MNAYSPTRTWQRAALALAGSVAGLAVMAGTALLFSDPGDRQWMAVAMGLKEPMPSCAGVAAMSAACGARPALMAQAPESSASAVEALDGVDPIAP